MGVRVTVVSCEGGVLILQYLMTFFSLLDTSILAPISPPTLDVRFPIFFDKTQSF